MWLVQGSVLLLYWSLIIAFHACIVQMVPTQRLEPTSPRLNPRRHRVKHPSQHAPADNHMLLEHVPNPHTTEELPTFRCSPGQSASCWEGAALQLTIQYAGLGGFDAVPLKLL